EADIDLGLTDTFYVYAGYGYHYWNRFLAGTPGYREIYSWYYTPIGMQFAFGERTGLSWALDLSIRPTSRGIVKVVTAQTYANGQDSQMNLGARTGYRIAVPFRWPGNHLILSLTPFFEHSAIGQSNTAVNTTLAPTPGEVIYEPNSHTDQFGVDLMVGWPL